MNYTIEYKGLNFDIFQDGNIKICQNVETGKINYTQLFGKEFESRYGPLHGNEKHHHDFPIGIAGTYAFPNTTFISAFDPDNAQKILSHIKQIPHTRGNMTFRETQTIFGTPSLLSFISNL